MLLEIAVLALGIPVGFLIAWMARDELVAGREWFRVLIILGIILGIWFWLTGFYPGAWTAGFIVIVSTIGFVKGRDERWTK
jgi:uncharacterized membrane protein